MAHLATPLAFPLGGDPAAGPPSGFYGFFPYGPYNSNGENAYFPPGPDEMIGPLDAVPVPLAAFVIGPTNDGAVPQPSSIIGPAPVTPVQGTALGPTAGSSAGSALVIGPQWASPPPMADAVTGPTQGGTNIASTNAGPTWDGSSPGAAAMGPENAATPPSGQNAPGPSGAPSVLSNSTSGPSGAMPPPGPASIIGPTKGS